MGLQKLISRCYKALGMQDFARWLKGFTQWVNGSPALLAAAIVLSSVGGKHVNMGLSPGQEHMLRQGVGREALLVAIVFMTTRSVVLALATTIVYVVVMDHLLHEDSPLCLFPGYLKRAAGMVAR